MAVLKSAVLCVLVMSEVENDYSEHCKYDHGSKKGVIDHNTFNTDEASCVLPPCFGDVVLETWQQRAQTTRYTTSTSES